MVTGTLLFQAPLALYLAATLAYGLSLWSRRIFPARLAAGLMTLGLFCHTLAFAARWLAAGAAPVRGLSDGLSLFAWVLTAAYLLAQLRTKTRVLGAFVSPVIFLTMLVASAGLGGGVAAPPLLQGALVTLHATLSIAGEALFALASLAGLMYLVQDTLLRRKKGGGMIRLLPSLSDLDRINHLGLLGGFFLLTLGGLAGSLWARIVWGSHWQWDPKQVWTLLAWGGYAFLLHQRLAIGWRGRRAARWSLALFTILLLLLIGGWSWLPSMHRFV
jgi:cytochrome c-type biogenesis protein CcsB